MMASWRRGNESPQTIQTSQPGNFSGEEKRGRDVPLLHTAKITFTQLGSRPDHSTTHTKHTHTHTQKDFVKQMETNTRLFHFKNVILTHLGDETEEERISVSVFWISL